MDHAQTPLINRRIGKWTFILALIGFLYASQSDAQDFARCEELLKNILPEFNRAFEENNPALLQSNDYRRKVAQLEQVYHQYHKRVYLPEDSLRRIHNVALIQALYGHPQRAAYLVSSYGLHALSQQSVYHLGLYNLQAQKYKEAYSLLSSVGSLRNSGTNMMAAGGQSGNGSAVPGSGSAGMEGKEAYNRAVLLGREDHITAALAAIDQAISIKDVPVYRVLRGDLHFKAGDLKKAKADYDATRKQSVSAQVRYGHTLIALGEFSEAVKVLRQYLEGGDRKYRSIAYLFIGHGYYGMQNWGEARRYYGLAAQSASTENQARCGLGNVLLSQRLYTSALTTFEKLASQNPGLEEAWLGKALAFYGLENYEEALAGFKRSELLIEKLAGNNKMADLFVSRGFCYLLTGKEQLATADFDHALKLDPSRYEAWVGKSSVSITARKYSDAGKYLSEALKYEHTNDRIYSNYGNLLLHFNMFEKASNQFSNAIRLNRKNVGAWNGLGVTLLEDDEMDRSKKIFDSLIVRNPAVPYLYNNRGIVNAYLGNKAEMEEQSKLGAQKYNGAFQDFRMAIESAPAKKFYNVNQGNVYRYLQQYDSAKTSYQQYLDKHSVNNLGVLHAAIHDQKSARYYLDVAMKLDSVSRIFRYNMTVLSKVATNDFRFTASTAPRRSYADISLKYSLDGFVTIYLYDYEYDKITFPGRPLLPFPATRFDDDYLIPHFDYQLMKYTLDDTERPKIKSSKIKAQKVSLGKRKRPGTHCPE